MIRPFYCGTQGADWQTNNCENCHMRGFYRDQKGQNDFEWRCDIQRAIDGAYIGDGSVTDEIGRRMGAIGNETAHGWRCPELIEIEPIAKYAKRFERPKTRLMPLWKRLRNTWRAARELREDSYCATEFRIDWRLAWQVAWGIHHDYTEVVKCRKCKRAMPKGLV